MHTFPIYAKISQANFSCKDSNTYAAKHYDKQVTENC